MTEYLDRYPTMHEYAEGKRINPKLTDTISRADAIEAVASITMSIHLSNVICDRLMALPSADAEWIPCSDRLPIPPAFCLVTTDGSHNDVIDIALYMSDGWHKASEVIAWMPLPKPYREDGEA